MLSSALSSYIHNILSHIPWGHWVIICAVAVVSGVLFGIRKKGAVYGAVALGLTVFVGLFLLDTAVGIRAFGIMTHSSGHNLTLDFSRLFQKNGQGPVETFSNIAVFVPFGFFLGEWLASLNRTGTWRLIGLVTLIAFGLSLCIECLQLLFHVGFFELTDLVMNTLGAFVGAGVGLLLKRFLRFARNDKTSFE